MPARVHIPMPKHIADGLERNTSAHQTQSAGISQAVEALSGERNSCGPTRSAKNAIDSMRTEWTHGRGLADKNVTQRSGRTPSLQIRERQSARGRPGPFRGIP